MKKLLLEMDGRKINTESDFHREISNILGFPEWYGRNLDALWDLLTGHIDTNVRLTWRYHNVSRERLGDDFNRIMSVFIDLKQTESNFELILD